MNARRHLRRMLGGDLDVEDGDTIAPDAVVALLVERVPGEAPSVAIVACAVVDEDCDALVSAALEAIAAHYGYALLPLAGGSEAEA